MLDWPIAIVRGIGVDFLNVRSEVLRIRVGIGIPRVYVGFEAVVAKMLGKAHNLSIILKTMLLSIHQSKTHVVGV